MKTLLKIAGGLVVLLLLVVGSIQFTFSRNLNKTYEAPQFQIAELVKQADLELGKRIYHVRAGCVDCHGENLAGKIVMDNPAMGKISGANLTPSNLKNWTDEEIAVAIRYGIHKEKRSLRFMPSFDFEGLSIEDTAALIAYIRSVPEVAQPSAENAFGPVAKVLSTLGKMPVMFPAAIIDTKKGFGKKPAEEPTLEFGRYLAHSCVGCHRADYTGGKIPGGDPSWPEASNIRLGKDQKTWTEENFKNMILTGKSPITGQELRMPMPIALLKQLNETEIKALWLYLTSLN